MKLSPKLETLASAWSDQAKKARIKTTTKTLLGKANAKTKRAKSVGTILIRTWRGKEYRAEIVNNGVSCNGTIYTSLSAAAKAITGQQISDPRFFSVGG